MSQQRSAPVGIRSRGALLVVAGACLATGAGLLVYFVAELSLRLALALTVASAALAAGTAVRRLGRADRHEVRRRLKAGLQAGILAVAAYDAVRLVVVELFDLSVRAFEAIPRFGELIAGTAADSTASWAVGFGYHLANGLGFAACFGLLLGYRGWVAGLLWAFALEALMLTFYPGWLQLRAAGEFTAMSVSGHVAYGVVLGATTRRLLTSR